MDKWYTDSLGRRRIIHERSVVAKGFYDDEKNRVYISFNGHPGSGIVKILDDLGFSYSKKNKRYYADKTPKTEELLNALTGTPERIVTTTTPKPRVYVKEPEEYIKVGTSQQNSSGSESKHYTSFTKPVYRESTSRRTGVERKGWYVDVYNVENIYYRGSNTRTNKKFVNTLKFDTKKQALSFIGKSIKA